MTFIEAINDFLFRLNFLNEKRQFDISGLIQAIGVLIQILITIIASDKLLKIFQIDMSWIFYSLIIIALIILAIFVWTKQGKAIRETVSKHRDKITLKIVIAFLLLIIVLLIWGIFLPLPPPPVFDPSGKMGDIDDVSIIRMQGYDRFVYTARGTGSHEWDWKYLDDHSLNTGPAQFGGVMYLYPPNNWGNLPGSDLRSYRKSVTWEARSLDDECTIEFVMGGIQWKWDNGIKSTNLQYPDSMSRRSLGVKRLTKDWQKFSGDLSDLPEKDFSNVIGGFGWVIPWGSNQVFLNESRTGSQNPRTFTIEIRNIQFK